MTFFIPPHKTTDWPKISLKTLLKRRWWTADDRPARCPLVIGIDEKFSRVLGQNIKKILGDTHIPIRLSFDIKNGKDVEILKTLDAFADCLHCRDITIALWNTDSSGETFVLNSIPVMHRYLAGKKYNIRLINVDPCYFKTTTDLKTISSLFIEPNNACNLSCPFCRTGRGERTKTTVLTFKKFRNIVDQFPVLPRRVELFGRGEPFLNPELFDMIGYLKKRGCPWVATSTNGHFLDRKHVARMIESRLDMLTVSLDSLRKKTYQRMRRGGSFDLVMGHLKMVSSLRRKGMYRPDIRLQFILTKWNEGEIECMKDFAARLAFRIEFRSLSSDNPGMLPRNPALQRNEGRRSGTSPSVDFCTAPWKQMVISCEGKVTMCPKSLNPGHFEMESSPLVLGDIGKAGLDDIWNADAYRALRQQMLIDKHAVGCPVRCPNPDFSLTKKIMARDAR